MNRLGLLGILGLFLSAYALVSAIFMQKTLWYGYFVVGGALFLAWINVLLKNKSLFHEKNILKKYFLYLLAAVFIEIIGRISLHLWSYSHLTTFQKITYVPMITYPFAFFFINESFKIIAKITKSFSLIFVLTTLINSFLHEIPNTFAREWVYSIPFISFTILKINIVVIVGWSILVAVPIICTKILSID